MSEYKLKMPKQGKAVVDIYHKVEDAVVGGYKAIENKFVDTFLEKVDSGEQNGGTSPDKEK